MPYIKGLAYDVKFIEKLTVENKLKNSWIDFHFQLLIYSLTLNLDLMLCDYEFHNYGNNQKTLLL